MEYTTVFEVTDLPFETTMLLPLLMVLIGLGISFFNIKYNKSKEIKKKVTIIFGFIFSGFALIFFLIGFPGYVLNRSEVNELYIAGNYKTVEGKIENFDPMPEEGHKHESFTVEDVFFEYSDFSMVHAFHNAASHGGPINENGQEVRLGYITRGDRNLILKIELKK